MINRFNGNVVPFASDATGTNRSVFGDTLQSDNIDDNLNSDFALGWEIVGLNDNPTKQDFNAMGYTLGALISYLYQQGIAEWNNAQEYRINSFVIGSDGKIYKALTGTLVSPNINHNPTTDSINWKDVLSDYALINGDLTKIFRVNTPVGNYDAVNKLYLLNYALINGDLTKIFRVANGIDSKDAVNKGQLDLYALINGDATKIFRVDDAVNAKDAINKSQLDASIDNINISISAFADYEFQIFYTGGF